MENTYNFDAIRPLRDSEVPAAINKLIEEPDFQKIFPIVYPNKNIDTVKQKLKEISSVKQFQSEVIHFYLKNIVGQTISELSYSGLENLKPDGRYLFMSNHRDIVLDSAFLNTILLENKLETTQIAIGSNLLIYPWIELLVKLNKSFVVKRNLPVRELLEASKELSAYIQYSIVEQNSSIWIAQKEGRTKDGNDFTHSGLLKMIHLSSKQSLSSYIRDLQLVPVAISYEIEPCDKLKAKEMYVKSTQGKYEKNPKDDLMSMAGGLLSYKGNVHFHFCKPLNEELEELDKIEAKNDRYVRLAEIIDREIHCNYKLCANNYIAYDIQNSANKFEDKYTAEQRKKFVEHIEKQISEIEGEKEKIKKIFLDIYANPVVNKIKK